jgi:hypothetical protein
MKLETNSLFGHKIVIKISTVYYELALPYIIIFGDWSIYLVIQILTFGEIVLNLVMNNLIW